VTPPQSPFTPPRPVSTGDDAPSLLSQANGYAFAIGALLFARSVFPSVHFLDWAVLGLGLSALLTLWPRLGPRRRFLGIALVAGLHVIAITGNTTPQEIPFSKRSPQHDQITTVSVATAPDTPPAEEGERADVAFTQFCAREGLKRSFFALLRVVVEPSYTSPAHRATPQSGFVYVSTGGPLRLYHVYVTAGREPCVVRGSGYLPPHDTITVAAREFSSTDILIPVPAPYRNVIDKEIKRNLGHDTASMKEYWERQARLGRWRAAPRPADIVP